MTLVKVRPANSQSKRTDAAPPPEAADTTPEPQINQSQVNQPSASQALVTATPIRTSSAIGVSSPQQQVSVFPKHCSAEDQLIQLDREFLAPPFLAVFGRTIHALVPALTLIIVVSWIGAIAAGRSPISILERGLKQAEAKQELTILAEPEPALSDALLSDIAEVTAQTSPAALNTPAPDLTELNNQISQIKFISGMIAAHRPTIKDCGAVAKDIVTLSTEQQIDPFYIAAVISIESRFGASERSRAGALGLMQILPATARELLYRKTGVKSAPVLTEGDTNISLGIQYIKELETRYSGNKYFALVAYNWGPANADRVWRGQARVPASVNSYANTILERSLRWRSHYTKAKRSAKALVESLVTESAN